MEREISRAELLRSIEAIKSYDVVETRVQLITGLGELEIRERSDIAFVVESLVDYTCLDVTQCILHKAIIQVATKFLKPTLCGGLTPFLTLGAQASVWCKKHLQMTIMSMEESQEEEHCKMFYGLLLDVLTFCSASFTALVQHPSLMDDTLMNVVESSLLEQLNLTKDSLLEIERIQSVSSEIVKVAHTVINWVVKLCEDYCQSGNHLRARSEKEQSTMDAEGAGDINYVANMAKHTVEKLCELGTIAASGGGTLVSILNVTWKGVVTLLQIGKAALEINFNVADIILTLISLANESLRCAAENWSLLKESISQAEARRSFVPVKFYLVNVVKIASLYPCHSHSVHRQLTHCALMIASLKIQMCHEEHLNIASEVLSELLDQTSMNLFNSLLNSDEVSQEMKFEILDCLFSEEIYIDENSNNVYCTKAVDKIFSANSKVMFGTRLPSLGRILLLACLMRSSRDIEGDVRLGITRKLGWLFDVLVHEEVYPCILSMSVPQLYGTKKTPELVWETVFASLIHSLKSFMIVASSSTAWGEVEAFLLDNFFHPHVLCWEIIMELWCFMMRYAETYVVNDVIDKLCSCLKSVASVEAVFVDDSSLRRMARSISMLVSCGTTSVADRVYKFVTSGGVSLSSSVMTVALLAEGFSLNLLSDNLRGIAKQRITSDYDEFIGGFSGTLISTCPSRLLGAPLFVLCASLPSLQIAESDIDEKTLKFLADILQSCTRSPENVASDICLKLLGQTLAIVSNMTHLYACNGMDEVIMKLQNLFITRPLAADAKLYQCKVDLALFMAGLGHIEMEERDEFPKSCAIWELYHMLLREQHWALTHLAIKAFGHFAARTSCNQLWRFVPQNAALSYDLSRGNDANEERFMSEFKKFLEKEVALLKTFPCTEQLQMLRKEALILKVTTQKSQNIDMEATRHERTDVICENRSNKKRKVPDEISKGVELLQSGLKAISDGLSLWEKAEASSLELHDKFLVHFSSLEDVITHLAGLASID
ncbi:uncharacterized protein LOC115743370 isoform X2 [Rhodamnia argentea]|uniref:Uncharacterized protein LOC115743370 isoform X2 n=1 Tax=Rhodamnia argentea TaxID=178133 RepID=A0A8B8PHP6_9MYRT|nr:uncharacterized protein LOC115743370 isoform X2 [Rhodamnia argentea]